MSPPPVPDAVILCAGSGWRLAGETASAPKTLLEIGGRTLLAHQVHRLAQVGVQRVFAVGGFRIDRLRAEAASLSTELGLPVQVVENADYEATDTGGSLWVAVQGRTRGFWVVNGDTLFGTDLLRSLQQADAPVGLAIEPGRCGAEEVKVQVDDTGRVIAIAKSLEPATCLGEYTGIARITDPAAPTFVAGLERVLAEHARAYYDTAFQAISDEVRVQAVPIDAPFVEIDFPEDLERARTEIMPRIAALERERPGAR